MEFRKYQHVERLGTSEVQDILFGECHIFYKIDGTNASVWLDDMEIKAGSRKRTLTLESDNAGFYNWAWDNQKLMDYLTDNPTHRLYGEWLVPHSLKTYREDAWRKFYVFDVCIDIDDETVEYIPYDIYKSKLEEYGIDYIPPIATIQNPTVESIYNLLEKTNQFLIEDGKGKGEGVVIKNYEFYNQYKRQKWAKVVTSEFKEKHTKTMGAPNIIVKEAIEIKIVDNYCTKAFIVKEYNKMVNDNGGWETKLIPRLLNVIYYELIQEESWNFIKKFKNPTINYKTLQGFVTRKIKETLPEVF